MVDKNEGLEQFAKLMTDMAKVRKGLDESKLTKVDKAMLGAYDEFASVYALYCIAKLAEIFSDAIKEGKE